MKMHGLVMLSLGFSTLLLGQTQGCNVNALLNALLPAGSISTDDNSNGANGSTGNANGATEIRLAALLSGVGAEHGNTEYRELSNRMKLKVELENAAPGSQHDIQVNGVSIGTLTIGALGKSEIEFDTNVEPNHLPWPPALSSGLQTGAVVQAGSAIGTLASN
jgi:hypothetical protein